MDAVEGGGEGCMVGVRDRPDVDALNGEQGIGAAGEGDDLVLAGISRIAERMTEPRPPVAPAITTFDHVEELKRVNRNDDI